MLFLSDFLFTGCENESVQIKRAREVFIICWVFWRVGILKSKAIFAVFTLVVLVMSTQSCFNKVASVSPATAIKLPLTHFRSIFKTLAS